MPLVGSNLRHDLHCRPFDTKIKESGFFKIPEALSILFTMHNVGSKKLRMTTPGSKQIVKPEIDTFGSEQPPELWLGILPSQPTMMECFELHGTGQQRVPDGATTTVIHPLLGMASTLEAMEVHLPIS